MDNNFKCIACEQEFFVSRYSFQVTKSGNVYTDKSTKKEVECTSCKSTFVETIKKDINLDSIMYGKFSSASEEDKKKILRKRANEHKKKTRDQYKTIDREFRGIANPKHY